MIWLRLLEGWAVARLLSSPTFHRVIQRAHRRFTHLKDGTPLEEMKEADRTSNQPSLLKHFTDELKAQLRNEHNKKH
ncbi:uncharacterized protein K452DRAFT_285062 [Aplosporella prunicola CBS 121167]|uniref:Uncharacterized protein n=1 Tax=Aplosporella prunicola CBS 121167 TaxID=1176127 RepID=A0A6A6BL27_9PEZI|nr:uncharacterized protein K452DRAFT_285062 [Aplosporella prunicola CBS 121167]KAF2144736.1 hypothetical protein K452DRAFT_285062 [Aplosporella prunicola CBS 121167]